MAAIDFKHAVVSIRDGASTPNTLDIRTGAGNITYTEKRNIEYRLNRGLIDSVRQGDQAPVDVSFDFEWWYITSATGDPVTPDEALKQVGAASGWVSSDPDLCTPYAVDIVITYAPNCGTTKNEIIVLQDFRWETIDHNLKDAQISAKGTCNTQLVTSTRVAPSPMPTPFSSGLRSTDMLSPPVREAMLTAGRDRFNPPPPPDQTDAVEGQAAPRAKQG